MNVLVNTITQPTKDTVAITMAMSGCWMFQTMAGIGRHCQNNSRSVRLAQKT